MMATPTRGHEHEERDMFVLRRCALLVASALLFLQSISPALAAAVESKLASGIVATAEYRKGQPDLPAVLILHGFLQTRDFPIIHSLTVGLADAGYTVLAPTLSLGINKRSRSLSCEAVHAHTMESDVDEVAHWVDWLQSRGHKNIVLIGHSFGGIVVAAYTNAHPNAAVQKLILFSLKDLEYALWDASLHIDTSKAKARLKRKSHALGSYPLSFCRKYTAPAAAYLSYASWTESRLLHLLAGIRTPIEVYFGSKDVHFKPDWPGRVGGTGALVTVIPGANHFFDGPSELELLGRIDRSLKSLRRDN
jgi:pimeloyl-ACP methyl ester carboxylesterase